MGNQYFIIQFICFLKVPGIVNSAWRFEGRCHQAPIFTTEKAGRPPRREDTPARPFSNTVRNPRAKDCLGKDLRTHPTSHSWEVQKDLDFWKPIGPEKWLGHRSWKVTCCLGWCCKPPVWIKVSRAERCNMWNWKLTFCICVSFLRVKPSRPHLSKVSVQALGDGCYVLMK